jgi:hypothetical protein
MQQKLLECIRSRYVLSRLLASGRAFKNNDSKRSRSAPSSLLASGVESNGVNTVSRPLKKILSSRKTCIQINSYQQSDRKVLLLPNLASPATNGSKSDCVTTVWFVFYDVRIPFCATFPHTSLNYSPVIPLINIQLGVFSARF